MLTWFAELNRSQKRTFWACFSGWGLDAMDTQMYALAIPTLIAAGGYSLIKERALLSAADVPLFAVGFVVSFIAAWVCVRWLLRYVSTHTFVPFAWYRIAFGLVILGTAYAGLVRWD